MHGHDDDHTKPPAASGATPWEITRRPIALVDDSIDDQWMLRRQLGFLFGEMPIITFHSGSGLFAYLRDHKNAAQKPWLILLDMDMTDVDGLPTLEMLGTCRDYADIPVLVISATEDRDDIEKALAHGARGFMPKPLKRGDFVELLNGREARPLRDSPN